MTENGRIRTISGQFCSNFHTNVVSTMDNLTMKDGVNKPLDNPIITNPPKPDANRFSSTRLSRDLLHVTQSACLDKCRNLSSLSNLGNKIDLGYTSWDFQLRTLPQ
jgi:hypothetical protein